jgi:hypothetical protein
MLLLLLLPLLLPGVLAPLQTCRWLNAKGVKDAGFDDLHAI